MRLAHQLVCGLGGVVAVGVLVVTRYTEIDWVAYMQEVEGPLVKHDFNYEHLEGDTGPLVYPAGFVYLFAMLRWMTNSGHNIPLAQVVFCVLHILLMIVVVGGIYAPVKTFPDIALPLAVLSRRAHSIFQLRLFNDGVAMLYAYTAVALAMRSKWTLTCVLFSLGVGIKMNVMLMAPGLAVVLIQANGLLGAAWRIALCGIIQVVLAWPFLTVNPWGYLMRSFDLGRVFLLKWTVNFKFLDEPTFQSPIVAIALLMLTLVTWLLFGHFRWARQSGGLLKLVLSSKMFDNKVIDPEHVAVCMLESNLIGIVFARSMHYQFYVWYAHIIPFLAFRSSLAQRSHWIPLLLVIAIEIAFNIFPATWWSSVLLQVANVTLLVGAWFSPVTAIKVKDG